MGATSFLQAVQLEMLQVMHMARRANGIGKSDIAYTLSRGLGQESLQLIAVIHVANSYLTACVREYEVKNSLVLPRFRVPVVPGDRTGWEPVDDGSVTGFTGADPVYFATALAVSERLGNMHFNQSRGYGSGPGQRPLKRQAENELRPVEAAMAPLQYPSTDVSLVEFFGPDKAVPPSQDTLPASKPAVVNNTTVPGDVVGTVEDSNIVRAAWELGLYSLACRRLCSDLRSPEAVLDIMSAVGSAPLDANILQLIATIPAPAIGSAYHGGRGHSKRRLLMPIVRHGVGAVLGSTSTAAGERFRPPNCDVVIVDCFLFMCILHRC